MRKAIVLGSVVALLALGTVYLTGRTDSAPAGDSPAFEALLSQAVSRLEGVPQRITSAAVPEAQADVPTVDEYTCAGFRTCDAIPTCDGTPTCDGEETCWSSTCVTGPTCDCDQCEKYTIEGGQTCDGTSTCEEGCAGWPTYFPGWPTCTGGPTCEFTCPGYVSCAGGGPSATERTTWGGVKAEFAE
jgi:hypothetical protein